MACSQQFPVKRYSEFVGNNETSDLSSSDSDSETQISILGTPRSLNSSNSFQLASPRAALLWDHGFDLTEAQNGSKSPEEREQEWRKFNKTDDDKLIADKHCATGITTQCDLSSPRKSYSSEEELSRYEEFSENKPQELPDLIPPMASVKAVTVTSDISSSSSDFSNDDSPPPLPTSSPPKLPVDQCSPQSDEGQFSSEKSTQAITSIPFVVENLFYTPDISNKSCSMEEDPSHEYYHEIRSITESNERKEGNGVFNEDREIVLSDTETDKAMDTEILKTGSSVMENDADTVESKLKEFSDLLDFSLNKSNSQSSMDEIDPEIEAEFEAIIQSLNMLDDSYIDRFAGRRDKYGFILSPILEAPSPTPSSLSGYSGRSSASPDPLGMFRMSPCPKSPKHELDLKSLQMPPHDIGFDLDQVPIYTAKRAIVIPEGFGWDSEDDWLSGSGDWGAT